MEYQASPNVLLEALAYLGARANGNTVQRMEERLLARGISGLDFFRRQAAPIDRLRMQLDAEVPLHPSQLDSLFRNLEGFPYSSTGSYSPAFLLFYPMLGRYDGDFDRLMTAMAGLSQDQVARHMLISLSLEDRLDQAESGESALLAEVVKAMSVPTRSRAALRTIHRDYRQLLPELGGCLRLAVAALEKRRDQLDALAADFGKTLARMGCREYLRRTSSLAVEADAQYCLRPFLLGPDTNLALESSCGSGRVIYCGVLRHVLRQLLSDSEDAESRVYEAIKLMGDRTRFDILCYIRTHPAYGQELSDHFGLARNTIHHHMSKLLNAGLVTCTVDGNRVYYAIDKANLSSLLSQQRALLLDESGE